MSCLIVAALLQGCSGMRTEPDEKGITECAGKAGAARLDSFKVFWDRCTRTGQYDSMAACTRPFFYESLRENDTLSVLYSGVSMSMAWLSMENKDSVQAYLSLIEPYDTENADPGVRLTLNYVLGTFSLKNLYNYPEAISHYQKCFEISEQYGFLNNMIAALSNIVHIYYIRSDAAGLEIAERAYGLSRDSKANDVARCMACISMAEMCSLRDSVAAVGKYLDEAEAFVEKGGFSSYVSLISLLEADMLSAKGEDASARKMYDKALEHVEQSEPGIAAMIYLHYGIFAEKLGDYGRAAQLYGSAERVSVEYNNFEYRRELYRCMSDLYYEAGDERLALKYYRRYSAFLDSVATQAKEFSFDSLLIANQRMEHNRYRQLSEIALLKEQRKTLVISAVCVLIMIAALSAWLLYRKQRRMYHILFEKYRNARKAREIQVPDIPAGVKTDADAGLFSKAEKLMENEKIFKQKDLSIEKLSLLLETNRTYLSRAINTLSGLTFHSWVNMYRIREATDILSDPDNDVPIKCLADDLGYNSVSVFYKAFQKETGLTPSRYRKEAVSAVVADAE